MSENCEAEKLAEEFGQARIPFRPPLRSRRHGHRVYDELAFIPTKFPPQFSTGSVLRIDG